MRNLKKETEWDKNTYKRFTVKVRKDFAEKFTDVLDEPFSIWVKREMEKYIEEKTKK